MYSQLVCLTEMFANVAAKLAENPPPTSRLHLGRPVEAEMQNPNKARPEISPIFNAFSVLLALPSD